MPAASLLLLLASEGFVPWALSSAANPAWRQPLATLRPNRAPIILAYAVEDDSRTVEAPSDDDDDASSGAATFPQPLPNTKDPFELLGVDRSSYGDMTAIKSAYKTLAKEYHPDASVTEDTPEDVKKRVTDDFSKINAAYELLRDNDGCVGAPPWWIRKGSGAGSSGAQDNVAPWHTQTGDARTSAAPTGRAEKGFGYGQSMGAWFETSFDEGRRPSATAKWPSSAPRSSRGASQGFDYPTSSPPTRKTGRSDGFVGFMEEDEKPFRTRWEESEAGAWSAPATHIQQRYNAYAPPPFSEPPSRKSESSASTTPQPVDTQVDVREETPPMQIEMVEDAAAIEDHQPEAAHAETMGHARHMDHEDAEEGVTMDGEMALEERCRTLAWRLKRAHYAAMEMEERLRRAEYMVSATQHEKQMLSGMMDTSAMAHRKEKEELEAKIKALEAEVSKLSRPWYEKVR